MLLFDKIKYAVQKTYGSLGYKMFGKVKFSGSAQCIVTAKPDETGQNQAKNIS